MSSAKQGNEESTLKLACPKCGASGTAPITHLANYFVCKKCEQWYRVQGSSFVPVPKPAAVVNLQVRMGFTDYRSDRYREVRPVHIARKVGRWLLRDKSLLAAAVVVLAAVMAVCVTRYRPAKPELVAALPTALEERVPVWIDAWVADDVPRLMQLTAPSYDRQLRQWVSHNRPPGKELGAGSREQGAGSSTPSSTLKIKPRGNETADVTAEVCGTDSSGQARRITLHQTWISTDGSWYFMPPVAAKSRR